MENMLPVKKKLTLLEKIKKYTEDKRLLKFVKNIQEREKRVDRWNSLTDNQKIWFIRTYMQNKFIVEGEHRGCETLFSNGFGIPPYDLYSNSFCMALLADIWKESNYEVQSNSYDVRRDILNDHRSLCISGIITKEFFSDTVPQLQQEIIKKIMDWNLYDDQLEWKMSVNAGEWEKRDFKCEALLYLIKRANKEIVCDNFEHIGQFLSKNSSSYKKFLNYIKELPEDIRKSQIEDSIYYTIVNKNDFDAKWSNLTYEDKVESYKNIMCTCISEIKEGDYDKWQYDNWVESSDRKNFCTLANDKKFIITDSDSSIYQKAFLSCNPKIFETMCADLKEEDFAKYFDEVMQANKDNPFTLFYFWDAMGTERQNRYFPKAMEILKDNKISQYELCNAQHMNSKNQKKKLMSLIKKINSKEELDQMLPILQSFIKKEKLKINNKVREVKKNKNDEIDIL